MENKQLYYLALSKVKGIGYARLNKLISFFGDIKNVWDASAKEWVEALGGYPKIYDEFLAVKERVDIIKYHDNIIKKGINYLTLEDRDYPELLKQIHDPPLILFYKGTLKQFNLNIAMVGSRKCTYYGKEAAKYLAGSLAEKGVNIISGMARGIDTYAHFGALNKNGYTTAVLGSGIDVIYPPENKKLYDKIAVSGIIVSEYHPGTLPSGPNFPARNRIISGLSHGVIVVEAAEKSGSLITVDFALEQGRDVFAVPGNINSKYSMGTNNLIRQGAKIVTDISSILEEYDINYNNTEINTSKTELGCSVEEQKLLDYIGETPIGLDELSIKTGLKVDKMNTLLTILEVKGLIRQISGKKIVRSNFK